MVASELPMDLERGRIRLEAWRKLRKPGSRVPQV